METLVLSFCGWARFLVLSADIGSNRTAMAANAISIGGEHPDKPDALAAILDCASHRL
jgi:hypothetical protein